jgi:hypothetical protein
MYARKVTTTGKTLGARVRPADACGKVRVSGCARRRAAYVPCVAAASRSQGVMCQHGAGVTIGSRTKANHSTLCPALTAVCTIIDHNSADSIQSTQINLEPFQRVSVHGVAET